MEVFVRLLSAPVRLWGALRAWWRSRWDRPYEAVYVEELPDRLLKKKVYVAGEAGHLWFVAFICPCGCGETLQMSLLPDARPHWSLNAHEDGTVSLNPSVRRMVGCRAHFFFLRGRISWCD
jgi:hypothetical protein